MKRLLIVVMFFLQTLTGFTQLHVTHLQIESRVNPLGVDNTKPVLSWQLQSDQRNVLQTAFQVLVSDDSLLLKKNIGNIWDSKKVFANTSIQVAYKGGKLSSAKKYFWKVKVWDNKGNTSSWSNTCYWQMGLLQKNDWGYAKWIGYDEVLDSLKIFPHVHQGGKKSWGPRRNVLPMMRKEFDVQQTIKSATAYICGLGQFEMYVNGNKIGDHFLDPGWTNYAQYAQYVTFDITAAIQQGKNAVGVMLGNGFYYIPGQRYRKMTGAYGHPKMIMRAVIEYSDGRTENIISDESWQTVSSPIVFSSIFGGEDYDANLEQEGWGKAGFVTTGEKWRDVIVTNGPAQLQSQMQEPLKVMQRFGVVAKKQLKNDVTVYDFGQNFSGIPSVTVNGSKGDTVKIFCAELLNADGTANQKATGSPSYFTYILKGGVNENWQPRFTYTGFRYMQVQCIAKDGAMALPLVNNIEGLHIRNAASSIGSFTCSSELFNKTDILIDWAIKSNMVSVFTDCPHREKLGWLEQVHLMGSSLRYGYDVANLMKKAVYDMMQSQTDSGLIPEIAPEFVKFDWGGDMFRDSPEWGSSGIILPWYLYKWYGEKEILKEAYPMMQRYISYLKLKANNHILTQGLGDWYDLGPDHPGVSQLTTKGVTATAIYYYDLQILSKIATLLGKPQDAADYTALAGEVKKAFNKAFFNDATKQYATGSQTSNAMALYMNLVDVKNRAAVLDNLIKNIRANNDALTAGDIGYRYLLRVLEDEGRSDVIYDMNCRSDVPGYGYQLAKGATALTESWQALPSVSNNHLMLGHIMEWFYSGLAGIRQNDVAVAFKEIIICPEPVGNISSAKATYESPYGLIASAWEKQTNTFELQVVIPVNTNATIYLPANTLSAILVNNQPVKLYKGLQLMKFEKDRVVIRLGSGAYHFTVINK